MARDDKDYPRDMIGYGRAPPYADWPNNARVAVQFVINYEEGGENNILHGDAASEAFLSEIVGAAPWPGMRHMNMESIYEYGSRAGFWRLHRMFTERSVPVTVYAVATAMARNVEAVAAMNEAGWEIATHGYKWIDYRDLPPEVEARHIAEAVRIHTEVAGNRPLGFYQGRSSLNTIRLGMEEGGFLYCADSYADDLPYWLEGPRGPQLIIPYTLNSNDMRFATPQGFNSGDQFYAYLRDSFDTLYAEGDVAPKMLSIGLHCRLVGRPGRAAALARFIDYVLSRDRAWTPNSTRHRASLDSQARATRRMETVPAHPHFVRRALRRRLRTFALDRGGGLRRGPDSGSGHGRGIGEGDGRRSGERNRRSKAVADSRPSRSRRQASARQDADGRIGRGAGERRARPPELR